MGLPILDILDVVGKVVDRAIPDPAVKADLQVKLATIADQESARESAEVMGQIQTNTVEASNPSLFVAGWRPAVGWVCASGVAYSFVLEPLGEFVAKLCHYSGTFPSLDMGNLMTLMMGMLGMGYLRTKEKINGIPDSLPDVGPISSPSVSAPKKGLAALWPF